MDQRDLYAPPTPPSVGEDDAGLTGHRRWVLRHLKAIASGVLSLVICAAIVAGAWAVLPHYPRYVLVDGDVGSVDYTAPRSFNDGAVSQTVTFKQHGQAEGLRVLMYANPQRLSPESWVRAAYDRDGLLELDGFHGRAGDGVFITVTDAWSESAPERGSFPVVAVVAHGDQIIEFATVDGFVEPPARLKASVLNARLP